MHEARSCRVCEAVLPLGPRPVVRASATARVLIIGQAPGTRVHATGIPWNDPSGERLRDWLAVSPDIFYDVGRIAIMPMGFCYPGRGRGGDMPPRPECAPLWHPPLLAAMPAVELVLLVGQYAQKRYLQGGQASLTENVRPFQDPAVASAAHWFPLPHPSPRNTRWLQQRPWFEAQVVPLLRQRLRSVLGQ